MYILLEIVVQECYPDTIKILACSDDRKYLEKKKKEFLNKKEEILTKANIRIEDLKNQKENELKSFREVYLSYPEKPKSFNSIEESKEFSRKKKEINKLNQERKRDFNRMVKIYEDQIERFDNLIFNYSEEERLAYFTNFEIQKMEELPPSFVKKTGKTYVDTSDVSEYMSTYF